MSVIGHNHIRRVDSFDGYEILAHPLPAYEDRVFTREDNDPTPLPVTYGSHDIRIGRPTGVVTKGMLAILMHHGGGRYILQFYEGALPVMETLLALPERAQYTLAYTLFKQADQCAADARSSEARLWAEAYAEGRIRKRRQGGMRRIFIETAAEKQLRLA